VLRAFDAEHPALTLSDVARTIGMNRASVRRFLHTLVELGYLSVNGRLFSLRPRVLDLGHAFLSGLSLSEVARPHLERLVQRVRESSSLAELDGHDVVYVVRVPTRRIMRVAISVGTRLPAYATAMGRVLLAAQPDDWLNIYLSTVTLKPMTQSTIIDRKALCAELDHVRRDGYAIVDQELEEGLRSIAAPIRDRHGRVLASINVSTHASRGTVELMRETMLIPLLDAATAIQEDSVAVTFTLSGAA
jgi:IclR family pca regulon transcriptional regulator